MHPQILGTRHEHWSDETDCAARAHALAHALEHAPSGSAPLRDACIELAGPLGAGKTTFTRHLLRALGVAGRIKSPSYAVVEPHEWKGSDGAARQAFHFDFYRFGDPREWEDAGFREVFAGPGLKLVEWAENAGDARPQPDLVITIATEAAHETGRQVVHTAHTGLGRALLERGCAPLRL
jgi:tRNA threonylcarbamoyladenosine biosynthesis protein TsaE